MAAAALTLVCSGALASVALPAAAAPRCPEPATCTVTPEGEALDVRWMGSPGHAVGPYGEWVVVLPADDPRTIVGATLDLFVAAMDEGEPRRVAGLVGEESDDLVMLSDDSRWRVFEFGGTRNAPDPSNHVVYGEVRFTISTGGDDVVTDYVVATWSVPFGATYEKASFGATDGNLSAFDFLGDSGKALGTAVAVGVLTGLGLTLLASMRA